MDDEALDLAPRAPPGVIAAEQSPGRLTGLLPDPLGADHQRDGPGRLRHLLAVDDLERGHPDDLVAQSGRGAIEVGQFLGGNQHRQAGLATAGQQRDHVIGAEG